MSLYYRVGHFENQQGLWYTPQGEFTGDIHNVHNFCKASALQMPFDQNIVGYISATPTLDQLFAWFSQEEIKELQHRGYHIMVYEAKRIKWYEPYAHWMIEQSTAKLVGTMLLQ